MAKSLEQLILEFARQARNQLAAEAESKKNQGIRSVKWQGFNEDGNPIVKDGDKTRAVRGVGNTGQVKNTKLIYDEENSVEYKRTKKERQPSAITRPEVKPAAVEAKTRAFIHPIEIFETVESILARYVVTYGSMTPPSYYNDGYRYIMSDLLAGGGDYYGPYPLTDSYVLNVPDFPDKPSVAGVKTFRICVGALAARSETFSSSEGTASGSISGGGLSLSISCLGEQGDTAIGYAIEESSSSTSIDLEVAGSDYYYPNPPVGPVTSGECAADAEAAFIGFPSAVYYYQYNKIPENPGDPEVIGYRQIDLNNITPNLVYDSTIVHNYIKHEGEDTFAYTVWFVKDVDMSQTLETDATDTTYEKELTVLVGRVTRYIVHARLNLSTGEVQSKINESPDTGTYTNSGGLINYRDDDSSDRGKWLAEIYLYAASTGPLFTTGHQLVTAYIDTPSGLFGYIYSVDFESYGFNPEAIWRESFEGDWLYSYKNIVWDLTAWANTTSAKLRAFLMLSYKSNIFYSGWDSIVPGNRPSSEIREFSRWDPVGTAYENNGIFYGDYQDFLALVYRVDNLGTADTYANYLDDFDEWRLWKAYMEVGTYDMLAPNFPIISPLFETLSGRPLGDRLKRPIWLSIVEEETP